MAVSKELLARYKELKAQGINVTLSELKAQMEAEENSVNNYSSEPQISETPKPTGFSALSSCTTQVTNTQSPEPVPTKISQTENTSWSTSYYSQPEESYEKPVETYTSSFEATNLNTLQSNSIESYSSSNPIHNEPIQPIQTQPSIEPKTFVENIPQKPSNKSLLSPDKSDFFVCG